MFLLIPTAVITAFVVMAPGAAPPTHEDTSVHWPKRFENQASVFGVCRYLNAQQVAQNCLFSLGLSSHLAVGNESLHSLQ